MGILPEKKAYPQTVTSPYTSTPAGHQLWVQPLSLIQSRTIFHSLFSSKPLSLAQTRLCPGEAPSYCRLLLRGAPAVWDALSGGGRRWSLAALTRQVGLAVPLLSRAEDQDDVSPSPVPVIVQLCPRAEATVSRFLPPGPAHCGLAQRMVVSSVTCDLQLPFSGMTPSQRAELP